MMNNQKKEDKGKDSVTGGEKEGQKERVRGR